MKLRYGPKRNARLLAAAIVREAKTHQLPHLATLKHAILLEIRRKYPQEQHQEIAYSLGVSLKTMREGAWCELRCRAKEETSRHQAASTDSSEHHCPG